jgi:hypothetical protein
VNRSQVERRFTFDAMLASYRANYEDAMRG